MSAATRSEFARCFAELVSWAAEANSQDLAPAVRHRAAIVLADDLAAIVMGSNEPEVSTVIDQFSASSYAEEATVFKRSAKRVDRYSAASSNGMAISWCELDEGFRLAPSHGGAYALPAILAEAEYRDSKVADVLRALAISYEVTGRLALAFKFDVMTVHPHAALATIGAAAGAALIQKQSAAILQAAVTNACAMTFAGPFNHAVEGALVRNAWTSAGAWIGMRSVDWANAGISGLAETPYDVFGSVFGGVCHAQEMTNGLGKEWAITNGYHKMYACCQYAHSAVEANLGLVDRLEKSGRTLDDVSQITVETHKLGLNLTNTAPVTTLGAKFSMPHAIASSSVMKTGGFEAFTSTTIDQTDIAALRQKVQLKSYADVKPWPKDRPARVTWLFNDGETWQAECESAKGGSDNPYSEDTILKKIDQALRSDFPNMASHLRSIIFASNTDSLGSWRAAISEMLKG